MTDERDDKLMQAAQQLTKNIRPQSDLWPGIAAAIDEQKPAVRRRMPMFAQAAAVLLLVGASSAVTWVAMKEQPVSTVVASTDMIFEQAAFTSRYSLGPGFQDARNALMAEWDIELAKLPAESRVDIEANLRIIRDAIVDTNAALEDEPDNAILQGRLLRAYRDELALLRRVSQLSRRLMMRNDI